MLPRWTRVFPSTRDAWAAARLASQVVMGDERLLSPEDLAALFKRLDALIEEARVLQQRINERLQVMRREDRQVRTGQPERRRITRKK